MQNTLFFLAALLYLATAFLPARMRGAASAGTVLAWLLHGGALWADMLAQPDALRLGFAVVLSATLWISVAAYWLENRNFSLDSLRVLVLPSAAVAVVLPAIFPGSVVSLQDNAGLYAAHIVIAIMAYSTLTIAAFHAVLMAVQEASLHTPPGAERGWFAGMIERLPALLTMEKLLFRMIGFGFTLLTLTVLSGIVFSEELFGRPIRWDHKTIFTLLSWVLFGLLLAGRRLRGWRGKTALSFTLSGFATLLLAYVGSRFVLEVLLHRSLA
jgi:ABC-type uncharacterized transport system permease subunit